MGTTATSCCVRRAKTVSDDNVMMWPGTTTHALPVDRIASAADKAGLKLCIIVGVDKHGDLYFASSEGDVGMVLWQLERAKKRLMEGI